MKRLFQFIYDITHNRFILFFIFTCSIILANKCFTNSWFPDPYNQNIWFYSGILMVLFSSLFIEPYYTSPKNVLTHSVSLLMIFISIRQTLGNDFYWFIIPISTLMILSIIVIIFQQDQKKSPDHWLNTKINSLKKFINFFGKGKFIYSMLFIYFVLPQHTSENFYTFVLFILWCLMILIDARSVRNTFNLNNKKTDQNAMGFIFGVQSKSMFLVKLFENKKNINKFDIVTFQYAMSSSVKIGFVFDVYFLNQEKHIKVLSLGKSNESLFPHEKNLIYKAEEQDSDKLKMEYRLNDFVGIVSEGSDIGTIKFEYSKENEDIEEGQLLEADIHEEKIFYQVINGVVKSENLEDRNEIGFIVGEAIQIGKWIDDKMSFQKYGWTLPINTPIFKAKTPSLKDKKRLENLESKKIGVIPGTHLPSVINLKQAVGFHTAILGVTGSGKSHIARKIINLIKKDMKVICIDFNKEFINELNPSPAGIISSEAEKELLEHVEFLDKEYSKFPNKQIENEINIKSAEKEIERIMKEEIDKFLNNEEENIRIFELIDVSNTVASFSYTKYFFRELFNIAKNLDRENKKQICIVLEEAHTIVPEWNFSGASDKKSSQSLVNSIGQIALQGRKYGIGFLVIAQRSANVSKTVLTQCNTLICFQAFDQTTIDFLSNYTEKKVAESISSLKQYHALVTGKAFKSNVPMIIDLTEEENNNIDVKTEEVKDVEDADIEEVKDVD